MLHSSTVKAPNAIYFALLFWQLVCCGCEAEHACPLPQNEHKEVKVDEILGRAEAEKAIKEAMVSPISALTLPSWPLLCRPGLCQFAACLRCSFLHCTCMYDCRLCTLSTTCPSGPDRAEDDRWRQGDRA